MRPRLVALTLILGLLGALSTGVLPAAAATVEVSIVDNAYNPRDVNAATGDVVAWTNRGSLVHTVTADGLQFDSGELRPGDRFAVTFQSAGTFSYYCRIHGGPQGVGMAGVVTVQQGPGVALDPVVRLTGPEPSDRISTAIAISQDSFADGAASAAVLARSDAFPDALAGTPLAIKTSAPLLLTPSTGLDERTRLEIQRAVPRGRPVYLLGGEGALSATVANAVGAAGYPVTRFAGTTRAGTAVDICNRGMGAPNKVLQADGTGFADALGAGAAAARIGGCVLLTNGRSQAPETAAYRPASGAMEKWAIGGAAAAADPQATPIVGADRFDTAVRVATTFHPEAAVVGVASGTNYPDGLGGGAHAARKGGALVLALPDDVPAATRTYLRDRSSTINRGWLYGGTSALSERVRSCVQVSISGGSC